MVTILSRLPADCSLRLTCFLANARWIRRRRRLSDRQPSGQTNGAESPRRGGAGLLDKYVDVPPHADEPMLRFWCANHTLTSVGIVVRRGAN
jgi:hypothetical protein